METSKTASKSATSERRPSHIVLQQDWGLYLAGKVLAVDIDLLAMLDRNGIKYRSATEREVALAAF